MASRVPELIDALVALGAAEAVPGGPLDGVEVSDGPQVSGSTAREWLLVGFDGDPDGSFESASTVGGWTDFGSGREETVQLTVAVIVTVGDTDVRTARERAYEIATRPESWFRADPTVGLRSMEAAIGASQLVQDQTEQGAQCRLLLTVAGRAFT